MRIRTLQTTHTMPTPGWPEDERLAKAAEFRADVARRGGIVTSERRIRNTVFDKPSEKTTLTFVVDWP